MIGLLAGSLSEDNLAARPNAFSGVEDVCDGLQRLAHQTRRSLGIDALATELPGRK